jgi:hypothetical protein
MMYYFVSRARVCNIGSSRKSLFKRARFLIFLRTDITAEGISLLKKILSNPHSVSQPFL